MKYGCCFNMIAGVPGGIGAEHLAAFRQFGYDYAELPLAEMLRLPPSDLTALRDAVFESGLPCEGCNNFFPTDIRLTGPNVDFPAVFEYVDRAIATAASFGAKNIVFGSGGAKHVPDGYSTADAYAQIVRMLQYAASVCAKYDMTIAIEPLRKAECNIINTFAEGARLSSHVGSARVGVLVDLFHLVCEDESYQNINAYGPGRLVHVHISNPNGRMFPVLHDGSETAYRLFSESILHIGYDGRISCEAYSTNAQADAPRTLALLQHYFDRTERTA